VFVAEDDDGASGCWSEIGESGGVVGEFDADDVGAVSVLGLELSELGVGTVDARTVGEGVARLGSAVCVARVKT
jgi:hypothetical protein